MSTRPSAQRGMTLLEVIVAFSILLVALVGFIAASRYAVTANALGHRRTTSTFLRAELIDRMTVLPRAALTPLVGYSGASVTPTFVVDGCYDVNGASLSRNSGWTTSTFACGAGTAYRSWVGAATAATAATWNVGVYVERLGVSGAGCTSGERFSSEACSAADLVLTD
jgi:prepilin-type N-terminal cleavage/methylation domain-containing protein